MIFVYILKLTQIKLHSIYGEQLLGDMFSMHNPCLSIQFPHEKKSTWCLYKQLLKWKTVLSSCEDQSSFSNNYLFGCHSFCLPLCLSLFLFFKFDFIVVRLLNMRYTILTNFLIYNTLLLTIGLMLYRRSLETIHLA